MINDISRASFHAPARRKVHVQFAEEDGEKGEEGLCGRLSYSMYGTRDAAHNWLDECSLQWRIIGFTQGAA